MMISENWASLKREASTLETYVEQRLQSREPPAPAATAAAPGGAAPDVEQGAAADPRLVRLREIEESLGKLSGVVERLSSLATASGSSPNLSIAQRFRDVLGALRQEHRTQATHLRQRLQAAALLGDAGARSAGAAGSGDASVDAVLLRERSSLLSHNRAIDEILAQAGSTSDSLRSQRDTLTSAAGRLGGFLTRIPGATQVMSAISARRSWNDTVVGLVIAACVCYSVYHLALRKT